MLYTNRNISLRSRLQVFDAVVKPTALFAMHVLPLKVADINRISATERRMKRCIVGWVRHDEEDWPTTMRRMRARVDRADRVYPTKPWTETLWSQQWQFVTHLHDSPCSWPRLLATWHPHGKRLQRRPFLRWDGHINRFCRLQFSCSNWADMRRGNMLRSVCRFSAFMAHS